MAFQITMAIDGQPFYLARRTDAQGGTDEFVGQPSGHLWCDCTLGSWIAPHPQFCQVEIVREIGTDEIAWPEPRMTPERLAHLRQEQAKYYEQQREALNGA